VQLFVDLDDTLADFTGHYEANFGGPWDKRSTSANWNLVRSVPHYFLGMPPRADMGELWRYVAPYDPIILTGLPASIPGAEQDKYDWVAQHLGPEVRVICCLSREKCQHAKPRDILIDDGGSPRYETYRRLWEGVGGIWVLHETAVKTIDQLRQMGL
jgi:hypothetical protein